MYRLSIKGIVTLQELYETYQIQTESTQFNTGITSRYICMPSIKKLILGQNTKF